MKFLTRSLLVCICWTFTLACGGPGTDAITATGEDEAALRAAGGTLLVDDDNAQCPDARYVTIQEAVDAASPGDTIKVCAGTYSENVIIDKRLTLYGAQRGNDGSDRGGDLAKESVVIGGGPFTLRADDITLDGFYVHELLLPEGDEDEELPGITTDGNFSGYRIRNNVIESTTIGLFPRSSGQKVTRIDRNKFIGEYGIATGEIDGFGTAVNVIIEENLFAGLRRIAISMFGADDRDDVIRNNTFLGGGGITFSSVNRIRVVANEFSDCRWAVDMANARNVLVENNTVRSCQAGIGVTHATSDVVIVHNRIAGVQEAGIRLAGGAPFTLSTGTRVIGNEIEHGGIGIQLSFAASNEIVDNDVEDNAIAGIDASADSRNNFIHDNEVRGNGPPDCRDASSDQQTAGTANTWLNNQGSTSSPTGLCSDHPRLLPVDDVTISLTVIRTEYAFQGTESRSALLDMFANELRWCRALLAAATGYDGPQSCGTPSTNLGTHLAVKFKTCASASWEFRLGPDFGRGGALYIDGVKVDQTTSDIWWGESWDGPLLTGSATLDAGTHLVEAFGFENGNAGPMALQFKVNAGPWTDASVTNLAAAGACPAP